MMELLYDSIYNERAAAILAVVERLELELEPMLAAEQAEGEAGLSAHDLRRILRNRLRWPQWREERFVPPVLVQKSLLADGRYEGNPAR